MAVPNKRLSNEDLHKLSHALNSDGDVAVRTLTELVGQVLASFSGLSQEIKITNTTIGDVASALPTTALSGRNSIIIYNKDPVKSLFIGAADVTASGANEGWVIDPDSYFSTDIRDTIVLYGIAPTSQTIDVKIMELA